MASLKDVRVKISGVKKTKQITKAMNMVASAKLRGAQQHIEHFRPYAEKFFDMLGNVSGKIDVSVHPLLTVREEVKTTGIIIATSDRGLCGSFNISIINKALQIARQRQQEGKTVRFYCVGKKARDALKKLGYDIPLEIVGHMGSLNFAIAQRVGMEIVQDFMDAKVDEVQMVYGEFISIGRQVPSVLPLLPIAPKETHDEHASATEYIYEPEVHELLSELLPRYINAQVFRGLLDTSASEHAARMAAMDNATKNCDDMTAALTLLFNKTRQAAITRDLMDIVGGVEALKG